jgi:hypothetical protein
MALQKTLHGKCLVSISLTISICFSLATSLLLNPLLPLTSTNPQIYPGELESPLPFSGCAQAPPVMVDVIGIGKERKWCTAYLSCHSQVTSLYCSILHGWWQLNCGSCFVCCKHSCHVTTEVTRSQVHTKVLSSVCTVKAKLDQHFC